jgi:phenylacetate-CoA ligase
MSKVMGRKDDMLVIRGVNVYPSEIERVLLGEPGVAPDYLLVVDERGDGRDLIACCERTGRTADSPSATPVASGAGGGDPGASAPSDNQLRGTLEHDLRETLGLRVAVAIVPPGTVPRTEIGKAVRVRRWSGGDPPVPGLDV